MLVIPALLIWALFHCCHLGNCGTVPCTGPTFSYSGSCFRFVDQMTDFWGARTSCLHCRGKLVDPSEKPLATFLSYHLNGTSWWVGQDYQDVLLHRGAEVGRVCMVLTQSGVLQEAPCLQKNVFICQTEEHDCSSENTEVSASAVESYAQTRHSARRTKRSAVSENDVPDVSQLAIQILQKPISGGRNLSDLLTRINYSLQDEDDTNATQLNVTLSLLNQLCNRLQSPDIGTSDLFSNLSNVVYFGVNSIIQAALSSCSQMTLTTQEKQSITDSALAILFSLQLATLANFTGEYTLHTPFFSMNLSSMNSSEVGHTVLSFPGQEVAVVFPSQSVLQSLLSGLSSVQVQMISFAQNPFIVDSSFNISGPVVSLSIFSEMDEVSVHGLTDNFQIFLPQNPSNATNVIEIAADKALKLSLAAPTSGSTLVITVSVNHGVPLDLYHGKNKVNKAQVVQNNDKDSHTWLVTPEMFSNPSSSQTFLVAPSNGSAGNSIQLAVSTFVVHCAYWNPNLQKWESEGCMAGPQTTTGAVQCLCNHLSFFGTSFLVPPVQIDVTRTAEYFSQISENPVIVILLACFYACYIMSVLWARRRDLQDHMQSRIIVPRENDLCGLYQYLITVSTGHRRGASTTAKVYLSIGGMHGQFGPVLLSDTKHKVFKSGNTDIFLLSLPYPLGELKSITLSHDGTGPHKRWYVTQVTIRDVQLKTSRHFLCNAWLVQPAKGDSSSKTFTAADDQELRSFRNIFLKKTLRGLLDEHIWISIINHPRRSFFTRVQRVSCCMCLLLCTTVINLMFWEMPQTNYPIIISVGSFSLSWKDIMIAVESALLMFPINLLIIYIFRNTRAKESRKKDKKGKKNANGKKGPCSQQSLATILEDLSAVARTLRQTSWNTIEVDLNQESSRDFNVLLQTISQLLQKQIPSETLTVSGPLTQLSSEELHALFCANYVSQKLKKVSTDLKQLVNQQVLDKQQYEDFSTQLQALLYHLDKCIPPVPVQKSSPKKELKKKRLPWWFLYIGWLLLITISIVSTYFTMMYGFLYGKQSSIRWIVSMTLSLFQSIFILQPLKVVGFAVFFALVLKKMDEEEEDLLDELEPADEYQTFDETTL